MIRVVAEGYVQENKQLAVHVNVELAAKCSWCAFLALDQKCSRAHDPLQLLGLAGHNEGPFPGLSPRLLGGNFEGYLGITARWSGPVGG